MPLSDTSIRNAKPESKAVRMFDGGGLYLEVSPAGGKLWRLKYRFDGKEKRLALGVYPDVSLKDARDRREAARKLLSAGVDPGANKKAQKTARTDAAREWLEGQKSVVSPGQHDKTLARLQNDVFPWLGAKPMTEISAPDVLSVIRRIDSRGARYTAHRCRGQISQVMRYTIATGRAERDPCSDLKGAIPPARSGNFASITDPIAVGEMLRAFDGFQRHFRCEVRPGDCAESICPAR